MLTEPRAGAVFETGNEQGSRASALHSPVLRPPRPESLYPLSSSVFPQGFGRKPTPVSARKAPLLSRIGTSFHTVIYAVDKNF